MTNPTAIGSLSWSRVEVPEGATAPWNESGLTIRDNDLSVGASRGVDGTISKVQALDQRRWFLGGGFSRVDGVVASRMARFLSNGTLDRSFAPPAQLEGRSIVADAFPDGRVLVAGDLPPEVDVQGNQVIRLKADGTVDPTFRPASGWTLQGCGGARNAITQIHAWPDGGFVAVGQLPRLSRCGPTAQVVRYSAAGTLIGQWELPERIGAVRPASDSSILVQHGSSLVGLTGSGQIIPVFGPDHPAWTGFVRGFAATKQLIWVDPGNGKLLRLVPNSKQSFETTRFSVGSAVINLQSVYLLDSERLEDVLICGSFVTPDDEALTGNLLIVLSPSAPSIRVTKVGSSFAVPLDVARNSVGEVALAGWVDYRWIDPEKVPSSWMRFSAALQPIADLHFDRVFPGPLGFELKLQGQAPDGYQIESSEDLKNWIPRFTNPNFNSGQVHLDTDPITERASRFYRIRF